MIPESPGPERTMPTSLGGLYHSPGCGQGQAKYFLCEKLISSLMDIAAGQNGILALPSPPWLFQQFQSLFKKISLDLRNFLFS
jgi:hypothetical protein